MELAHPPRTRIVSVLIATAAATSLLTASPAKADILWNNGASTTYGGLVTNPGAGNMGADADQASANFSTTGFATTTTHKVADDFTVPAGGWNITSATGYAYMIATYPTFPPADPITGVNFSIYNGVPGSGGTVIATSTTLLNTSWTGAYRDGNGSLSDATRPVMAATADFGNLSLAAGTYWISFNFTGSAPGGVTAGQTPPLMTVDGSGNPVTVAGNARFLLVSPNNWQPQTGGTPSQGVEIPFLINGSVPAPGAAALLGLGGLVAARRRRAA